MYGRWALSALVLTPSYSQLQGLSTDTPVPRSRDPSIVSSLALRSSASQPEPVSPGSYRVRVAAAAHAYFLATRPRLCRCATSTVLSSDISTSVRRSIWSTMDHLAMPSGLIIAFGQLLLRVNSHRPPPIDPSRGPPPNANSILFVQVPVRPRCRTDELPRTSVRHCGDLQYAPGDRARFQSP